MPYLMPVEEPSSGCITQHNEDPNLRSTRTLHGYHIQTGEGKIGHVTDFIIDEKSWAIHYLVAEAGHWFSGKEIVISPKDIVYISYEESKVFVKMTKEAILEAPEYHLPPLPPHRIVRESSTV